MRTFAASSGENPFLPTASAGKATVWAWWVSASRRASRYAPVSRAPRLSRSLADEIPEAFGPTA